MVVLSVQISVNLSVLKDWGLHPLDEVATLAQVLEQFQRGEIEGCSHFVFPDALLEQPFECYIAPNLSGPFQTAFRCARVGEIHRFGRCLRSLWGSKWHRPRGRSSWHFAYVWGMLPRQKQTKDSKTQKESDPTSFQEAENSHKLTTESSKIVLSVFFKSGTKVTN